MNGHKTQHYMFGPFRLNADEHVLLRDGQVVPLAPKAVDLLVALVANSDRLLSKNELMKLVWPDTFVEEANLSHHVFTLRKALEGDSGGAKYIETIPRRGYRFVAPVTKLDPADQELVVAEYSRSRILVEEELEATGVEGQDEHKHRFDNRLETKRSLSWKTVALALIAVAGLTYLWARYTTSDTPEPLGTSIAVLPFKPLVAGSRDEALELGMAETLASNLSKLRNLRVKPISAVRKYNGLDQDPVAAGRELQVDSVLDASIQQSGDRLRVVARLVSISSGATLWSDRFDEKFTDIFTVQDRLADRMTTALALKVTGEERKLLAKRYTDNTEAYQLYLKGRHFWGKFTDEGLRRSIEFFEEAIAVDPAYALAYTGLASAYTVLAVNGHIAPKDGRPKAKDAVEKALELDDTLAWAQQCRGAFKLFFEWDWRGAEADFKRAIALDPNLTEPHELYSYLLSEQGRFEEALAQLKKAQDLNPIAINIGSAYGDTLRQARRYDEAIEALKKTREMDSNDFFLRYTLGLAYAQKGLFEQATEEMQQATVLSGNATRILSGLGQVYGLSGKRVDAMRVISELQQTSKQRYVSPLYIAMVFASLGEKDNAFAWLESAYADRAPWLVELGIEPVWDKLRPDPRFSDLLRRVGLTH